MPSLLVSSLKHDISSVTKNVCSQKLIKINSLKWFRRLIVINLVEKFWVLISFHPIDFASTKTKESANVSLTHLGALEVWPNKLSRTEERFCENSAYAFIIQRKLSHSVPNAFIFKNRTFHSDRLHNNEFAPIKITFHNICHLACFLPKYPGFFLL